jgi:fatty acid desaturase
MTPKPRSKWEYFVEISGLSFWLNRPTMFLKMATGRTQQWAFVPDNARTRIAVSASAQLVVYIAGLVSIAMGYQFAALYFFLPTLLAQPLLRAILITEHTGCSHDENGLTNTRTTMASFPIRLLMWNMPYHTEHHLYPSIPFHRLPHAHQELKAQLTHLAPNYISTNVEIVKSLSPASIES